MRPGRSSRPATSASISSTRSGSESSSRRTPRTSRCACPTWPRRGRSSRRRASRSTGRSSTPVCATWPSSRIRTETRSCSTAAMRTESGRTELLERYKAIPLPTTKDESWRFTDLKGFDPDSFSANGSTGVATAPGMLELEAAGIVRVSEGGLEIERAPEGIRFEPLRDHPRLGELVGSDEKFAAHNAALWEHGLLVHVPKGIVLEQPLYVRIVNAVEGGSLFWRLLIVAEPESR